MIEIIPAIDIIEGKCVRLSQGDYSKKIVYNENPVEVAKMFADAGLKRLHLVDLDGAKANHIINHNILEKIALSTGLVIDFGGGIKSDEDLKIAFESGASMVTGGSIAVKNPAMFISWIEKFGSEKIILGADVKNNKIATNGWIETSDIELIPYIRQYFNRGVTKVICTDINLDGMLKGPAIDLYENILSDLPQIYLIASGGLSSVNDIDKLIGSKIPAVITGKAIYEGRISLHDLSRYC